MHAKQTEVAHTLIFTDHSIAHIFITYEPSQDFKMINLNTNNWQVRTSRINIIHR